MYFGCPSNHAVESVGANTAAVKGIDQEKTPFLVVLAGMGERSNLLNTNYRSPFASRLESGAK